ncbi:MAG: NAD(P)/FAD-dependent oxidoreductase [Methanoregulaceae archaeon]|nr:NAD(P)/FAD-dependent oxidoreductase [Methanoregulaceae archaeon]
MADAPDTWDLIVTGAGPAGLFCAIQASKGGKRILVLEKGRSPGRKLLITGSGQCNLTHKGDILEFFSHYGDNGSFLKAALRNFTNRHLIDFFGERGCPTMSEPDGKIFPLSRKASDILGVLLSECGRRGVTIRSGEAVTSIRRTGEGFHVTTDLATFRTRALVLSTGGASYPMTGSSGDGYRFARSLGQPVSEIAPALTPVYIRDYQFGELSGRSFRGVPVSIVRGGKQMRQTSGDVLLTHHGLSGPCVLDLSRYIREGDTLRVGFLSGMDAEAVKRTLIDAAAKSGARQAGSVLRDLNLPVRLARKLLELAGLPVDVSCAQLTRSSRNTISGFVTGYRFEVGHLGGFDEAMVTRGGVILDGINPKTMESRLVPDLYFIGEVLDIDGDTGGYNLQAAFSTAASAADHLVRAKWTGIGSG